ncbi:MAG: UDP-N-acetylmuramoyl-tripeptide--D-alanyl-D-alanine ligase [Aquiluna sp.]|nr:UDP-N-acetylmuramoyl-tripeptide--D-alanyl-D-alanine ligase [Aquiluna sp.]MCF8544957.1 UDP-N-acetylmuramoyl-tripeptide--D-alanyl-D-alanine ligase [Aquiluna sp.]
MIEMTLGEIAAAVSGVLHFGRNEEKVSGRVDTDSRLIGAGDIFFAKLGEKEDGHLYLGDVSSNGASLAVVSQLNSDVAIPQVLVDDTVIALSHLASNVLEKVRQSSELEVIGITGSNGKTSTKNMLRAILESQGKTVAPRDSFNNEVGLPLTVLKLEADTRYLVLELGAAGPGSIEKLASWTKPDYGVQLKVGLAHAGAFGGIEATEAIKAELMPHIKKVALLNFDDPRVKSFSELTSAKVIGFGYDSGSDYQISDAAISIAGTSFNLKFPDGDEHLVSLKILGEHHSYNAAAALAISDQIGIDRKVAISCLEDLEMAERWRMQLLKSPEGVLVINDAYNASPDSMRAGLQTLATLGRQGHRTVAILGQMAELGEFAAAEHDALGRLVVRYNIDKLFVIGEAAKLIHLGAMFEGSWDGESEYFEDVTQAFEEIRGKLTQGDVVLVKSSNVAGLRFFGDKLAGVN